MKGKKKLIVIFCVVLVIGFGAFFVVKEMQRGRAPVLVTVKDTVSLRIKIPDAAAADVTVICLTPDYITQSKETGVTDWTAYPTCVCEMRQLTLDSDGMSTSNLNLSSSTDGTYTVLIGTNTQTYTTTFRI